MTQLCGALCVVLAFGAGAAHSSEISDIVARAQTADVVIVGEVHDNAHHHVAQAAIAAQLTPRAVVFETLRPDDPGIIAVAETAEAAAEALDWADRGWPEFHHYYQIIEAVPTAVVFGAEVPREDITASFGSSAAGVFGEDAARFGLDQPLDKAEQTAREARQMAAHCDALPPEMLPGMVEVQRLRDAALSQAVLQGREVVGSGPVLVITGNGHAHREWGVPALLAIADPSLEIFVIEQLEAPGSSASADAVLVAPPADRPDPCAAFN